MKHETGRTVAGTGAATGTCPAPAPLADLAPSSMTDGVLTTTDGRAAVGTAGGRAGGAWPETLEPDAWLDGGTREPNQLLGFGAGPRFCPGRNLALLEAKTALAVLAAGFTLTPGPGKVTERFAFTTIPDGLRITLRPRGA